MEQPGSPENIPTSRRHFLRTTARNTIVLIAAGWSTLIPTSDALARRIRRRRRRLPPAPPPPPTPTPTPTTPTPTPISPPVLDEATISQLQAFMASGAVKSQDLVAFYQQRIASLNPLLHAVIELNPHAMTIAQQLDAERRNGRVRGPLHGIPILIKDNIATADSMQTTAGSLALIGSRVPADAVLVNRLRAAGAIILGKANLSEWANFRGARSINGWSARGGFTRNAYRLDFEPGGSSSGSAVATAANMCAAAVGTETAGSIVHPAANNLVVGIKPTVGLISQEGIIPVARSQDTAGPIARTVTDAAILLGVMQSPFGPVMGYNVPSTYTSFLQRGALRGARIGVDRRYFTARYGAQPDSAVAAETALAAIRHLGATVIDTDAGDPLAYSDATDTVLRVEFKAQIAHYLAALGNTSLRTLADLIAFNNAHCPTEMHYFGQEIFHSSQATHGDLNHQQYVAARALCVRLSRAQGIDAALQRERLDAIVAPGFSLAFRPAAIAGYPNISVPIGLTSQGKPAGLWMWSGFLQERKLLGFAFDLEQELQPRSRAVLLQGAPSTAPAAGPCP